LCLLHWIKRHPGFVETKKGKTVKQIEIRNINSALTVSGKAINGATLHGAGVGISHNNAAAITADRNAMITHRTLHENAKTALALERLSRDNTLEATRSFAVLTRDMLKPHLGSQHSLTWTAAGFSSSLMVPQNPDAVILVVESLSEFLTGRPDLENGPLGITAAQADIMLGNLVTARNAVKNKEFAVKNALDARNAKYDALRKRLRGLVKELSQLIDPLDNRWTEFGLNRPGAQATPDVPVKVSAVLNATNGVAGEMGCRSARRLLSHLEEGGGRGYRVPDGR